MKINFIPWVKLLAGKVNLLILGLFFTNTLVLFAQVDLKNTNPSFSIAVLPDVQYYTAEKHHANIQQFDNQINWIIANRAKENIAYVTQLGDITDHGDKKPIEWTRAKKVMYKLEKSLSDYPDGIPYGVAMGNHDMTPNGNPNGTKNGYTEAFGRAHFKNKSYYGGSYNEVNDNHYQLFSAGGKKFIVLYLSYNEPIKKEMFDLELEESVYQWGADVLSRYKDHKAIIVSHSILKRPKGSTSNYKANTGNNDIPSEFTSQGERIYNKFKHSANVFLMLCGHISGEGMRKDVFEGNTIYSILTDYQGRRNPPYEETNRNGGEGIMRLMTFNLANKTIEMRTFIPDDKGGIQSEETDADSKFTIPY